MNQKNASFGLLPLMLQLVSVGEQDLMSLYDLKRVKKGLEKYGH